MVIKQRVKEEVLMIKPQTKQQQQHHNISINKAQEEYISGGAVLKRINHI